MLTAILITAVIGLLGVLSHRRSRLENKIYKNVPLSEWIVVFILPIALYICWFFIIKNIVQRPNINLLPFEDFDILAVTILFMVYGFVGNSIHFTSKILWGALQNYKSSHAYKINEMFHGKLSHYLAYLNAIFILYLLPVLEINHPLVTNNTFIALFLITISGIVFGVSGSKAIFYTNEWFGGYNKPIFFIVSILLLLLLMIEKYFQLKYIYYPLNLFIVSMGGSFSSTFILRQLFIFARLGNKRRLRFLAKILSV